MMKSIAWGMNRTPRKFIIEQKQRQTCFGNPGYIDIWQFYSDFETESERDKAFEELISFHNYMHIGDGWYEHNQFRKRERVPEWLMN